MEVDLGEKKKILENYDNNNGTKKQTLLVWDQLKGPKDI